MVFNKLWRNSVPDTLSKVAIRFPSTQDYLTWGDTFKGNIILGGTGVGKTSAAGKHYFHSITSNDARPGGLIFTIKEDDRERFEMEIAEAGRSSDLVIIAPDQPHKFNLLEYTIRHSGKEEVDFNDAGETLMEAFILGEQFKEGNEGNGANDRFWEKALARLLSRTLMLMYLADVPLTIGNMNRLLSDNLTEGDIVRYHELHEIITAEGEDEEFERAQLAAIEDFENWKTSNFLLSCFDQANDRNDLSTYDIGLLGLLSLRSALNQSSWNRHMGCLRHLHQAICSKSYLIVS